MGAESSGGSVMMFQIGADSPGYPSVDCRGSWRKFGRRQYPEYQYEVRSLDLVGGGGVGATG